MLEPGTPFPPAGPPGSDAPLRFAGAAATGTAKPVGAADSWKVLIVDDEEEVHSLTRIVLRNYVFEGRGLDMLSAYSAAGARRLLAEHPDIALILLDVVMEREDSGLKLVQHIRGDLQNRHVRIVLRTGQPGQAPELEVVSRYDINDYRAKTELTSQKLMTTVTSALRSWRDILTIERSRRGLQRVVAASGGLFEWRSRERFARAVLQDLVMLPGQPTAGTEAPVSALVARREGSAYRVADGVGRYGEASGQMLEDVDVGDLAQALDEAIRRRGSVLRPTAYVRVIRADNGQEILFLLEDERGLGGLDTNLVRLFMSNAEAAFHNVNLSLDLIEAQKEIIQTLGDVVETRSQETAHHVLRVGKMAGLLARRAGLGEEFAGELRLAAPMHDVGKVGTPDAILNKPGKLEPGEYARMQEHAAIGREILSRSDKPLMRLAAEIAGTHHEKWDGSGYPAGLRGVEIPVSGRVTAICDVFDALANKRVYRDSGSLAEALRIVAEGRGTHFDPDLVDVFMAHRDEFIAIQSAHPDGEDAVAAARSAEGEAS